MLLLLSPVFEARWVYLLMGVICSLMVGNRSMSDEEEWVTSWEFDRNDPTALVSEVQWLNIVIIMCGRREL
jgi:hypothetical protein